MNQNHSWIRQSIIVPGIAFGLAAILALGSANPSMNRLAQAKTEPVPVETAAGSTGVTLKAGTVPAASATGATMTVVPKPKTASVPGKPLSPDIGKQWPNLAYAKQSQAQKLDLYLPKQGKGPFPVILMIHGGSFIAGDKRGPELKLGLQGLKRGYAVASMNYRLAGEAGFPAQIYDVKAAIRFLRANRSRYNLDGGKIGLWGVSAGGGLAALAGTSGGPDELSEKSLGNPSEPNRVQAVVDWYGPINLYTMEQQLYEKGGPLYSRIRQLGIILFGSRSKVSAEALAQCNPEMFISPDDPPFFIQHGTADPIVPVGQSKVFADKLTLVLGKNKVTFEMIQGAGHGGTLFTKPKNIGKVFDFLDANLKAKP